MWISSDRCSDDSGGGPVLGGTGVEETQEPFQELSEPECLFDEFAY